MNTDWSDIRVLQGASCEARLPVPLTRDAPWLRPRDLAARLAALAETAPSPWRDRLRAEPAVVVAQILSFRPDDAIAAFDLAADEGTEALIRHVRALSRRIDDWLMRIEAQLPEAFGETIAALERQMGLRGRVSGLAARSGTDLAALLLATFGSRQAGRPAEAQAEAVPDRIAEARALATAISAAHRQMIHAVASLQPAAATAFAERIEAGTIEPGIGLILAELSAAGLVDDRLNRFTRRHTDFYYREILGQPPADATPERVLLHVPPAAAERHLPRGTTLAARGADGAVATFRTLTAIPVSTARVRTTGAITFETDPQVSFFATLGAITRVEAGLDPAGAGPLGRGVFVARNRAAPEGGRRQAGAEMGLDIASDLFRLREGRRQVEVRLDMRRASPLPAMSPKLPPGTEPGRDPNVALELRNDPELIRACGFASLAEGIEVVDAAVQDWARNMVRAPSMAMIYEVIARKTLNAAPLRQLLGRIVTLSLVEGVPWPEGDYLQLLLDKNSALQQGPDGLLRRAAAGETDGNAPADGAPASLMAGAFQLAPGGRGFLLAPCDVFQKFFADAFTVTLTSARGPVAPEVLQILPNGPGQPPGVTFRMTFGREAPPLEPDPATPEAAPALAIRAAPDARICPVSFFERYEVDAAAIRVRVEGLRTMAGFNDDGPVAVDQAVLPFGARPADGGTLTLAAPELAVKPVTHVSLDLTWADLPAGIDGFAGHYAAYPRDTPVPDPLVTVEVLSGETWKPLLNGPTPMADRDPASGRLLADWHREADLESPSLPEDGPAALKLPKARGEIRSGALRLRLSGSAGGFGQTAYALGLADALRPRLLRLRPRPVPLPPYLPRIARLRIGYEAAGRIALSAPDSARARDRVRQITPFGTIPVFPERTERAAGLVPARLGYGTLFLQLSGNSAKDNLALLFDIADSGHERVVPDPVPLAWHYLTEAGWQDLPATAISSDTTDGLLRSGTVVIDMPDDASETAPDMPPGGIWLAVSAVRPGFHTHPVLDGVHTNGVWAESRDSHPHPGDGPRDWRFDPGFAGLGKPVEVDRRIPPRPPETPPAWRARVAERLRHRKRAVTPWDVERLVLQEFPEIWRVKCLSHLTAATPEPAPGRATVVLVRRPPEPTDGAPPPPRELYFDVGKLERVRAWLQAHACPFAGFDVVNPAFDRLQVRARIRFAPFLNDGALAFRLRQDLIARLSVWTAAPEIARFGWSLNVALLRAQIAALDYVEDVTDFSVLHFAADDSGVHRLADTAQIDGRGPHGPVIRPSRPWALALSASDHALAAATARSGIEATQSGIGRLRVGDMLIVGQETAR
ncbi:hypothetical protein [Rhodovulum visakhapatnamense]|uniref:Baseplate J-like protein n=1 Tax=Rhodovulum visakhapatnamense TaxID=364297 RepID=A0A4R8FZD2_9RHOB|nr:hypothetical protein [Rhodovulum visakhapatnamense]TDX32517.1 hypothetical protein EV657_10386 [Rhodovulum visakhapatnamense]